MTEEASRIIKNIRQMEVALADPAPNDNLPLGDENLEITTPLSRCLKVLKEKHNAIAKIHRERLEEIKSE